MALQHVWNVGSNWHVDSHTWSTGFGTVAGFNLTKQNAAYR
jgi:hypothetical protein